MDSLILIFLVIMPGVWSGDWGVTFENQCALKGTSVVIKCQYDYPFGNIVRSVSWSKAQHVSGRWELSPLSDLPSPRGHFKYVGNYRGNCDLEVTDVQLADRGAYFFSFVTTFNRWKSKTYAYLSVKELTAVVLPSTVTEGDSVSLACVTGCSDPMDIVWFRDGQRVYNPDFQARREDAGRYHCAVLGQERVRSASVALNVQYAPRKVTLSVSPSGDVIRGGAVTLTCSSDANPPVTASGYRLFKDGQFISSGQNHNISDVQPGQSGRYYCQAWNNISRSGADLVKSTEVHLDVQYRPVNISVSVDPQHVAEGSRVNLTCSSAANPAAENYTWYKRTGSLISSLIQVGSGQVLSLPSMEASHAGLYLCQARNSLGENNSPEVLLAMEEKQLGSEPLPVLAGIGAGLLVTLVIALLLLWKKHRTNADKKQTVLDPRLSGRRSDSSGSEDPYDTVYANIQMSPSSPPPHSAASQRNSHYDVPMLYEDEVTYSTVTIKSRNPGSPQHTNSRSRAAENDDSVIYSTVVKSS